MYPVTNKNLSSRHDNAIVIRDPRTQQLILRGATPSFDDCPTCHRPLSNNARDRSSSPRRSAPPPTAYISPEYFRMLHHAGEGPDTSDPPSSPIRRLVEPALPTVSSTTDSGSDVEFVTSTPAPQTGHSIRREAFSPNYFKKFFIEEKELGRGGKGVVLLVRHELDSVSLGMWECGKFTN